MSGADSASSQDASGDSSPSRGATIASTLVLLAAAGLLSAIARRVNAKRADATDRQAHDWMLRHRSDGLDLAARPVTLLSIPLVVVAATAALVWRLHRADRDRAAAAIGVAPVIAATVGQSFTSFFPQRDPPDHEPATDGAAAEASFPSGHTTGVTAEALAIAYVLTQEQLATPGLLALLVTWPVVVGISRVYRGRHWLSDTLGGWAAGVGVAAIAALVYQIAPGHGRRTE